MLDAYDGSMPHPRSKSAFLNAQGNLACIDGGASPAPADCLYHFNSLGFRGEEFDPAARFKIFVSGCSYTFGLGVAHELTWPALLKTLIADRLALPHRQVNLQNFSQIGASNGYVARTIVRQCDLVRPDLAVIAFTHRERTEYLAPATTRSLGLWDLDTPETPWAPAAARYFDLHNTESASLDLLRNMLMVQWAMVRRGIPYLLLWMNRTGIDQPPIETLMPLRALMAMIDRGRLGAHCLLDPGILVDSNPVDRHPGPRSHANFAPRVLEALDLSAPKSPAIGAPPVGEARSRKRHVLLLGGSCPAGTLDRSRCNEGRCVCRQMDLRHRFLEGAIEPPLAATASNDRIVRTLLAECRDRKPDFVFARFSDSRSGEHFLGETLVELDREASESPAPGLSKLAAAYRDYTTEELHDLNTLQNILMAQEFLLTRRVPYVLSIPPSLRRQEMTAADRHPVLRKYAALILPASLCHAPRRDEAIEPREAERRVRRHPVDITRAFVDRLKKRLRKSRTEDPNIYPLW